MENPEETPESTAVDEEENDVVEHSVGSLVLNIEGAPREGAFVADASVVLGVLGLIGAFWFPLIPAAVFAIAYGLAAVKIDHRNTHVGIRAGFIAMAIFINVVFAVRFPDFARGMYSNL